MYYDMYFSPLEWFTKFSLMGNLPFVCAEERKVAVGLKVKIKEMDDKTVLQVEGRLDATSAPVLENKLDEIIGSGRKYLVIDLAKVDYLSSAGMRLLLATTKKLKKAEGNLHFCSVNDEVMEIIKMGGFERILMIFPTEREALSSL